MNKLLFFTLIISLFITSCKKEEIPKDDDVIIIDNISPYQGTYYLMTYHTTGLHPVYDSMGTMIDAEQRTDTIMYHKMIVARQYASDTLVFYHCLKSWNHLYVQDVKGVLENDTVRLDYDQTNLSRADYVRGLAWLKNDTLYMDYQWNTSDIWTHGALPIFGTVTAKGTR